MIKARNWWSRGALALGVAAMLALAVPASAQTAGSASPGATSPSTAAPSTTKPARSSKPKMTGPVNVNSASLNELRSLPGVGAKTAQKIVDNRPYKSADDLVAKKVVTQKRLDRMKDRVVVQ